MARFEDYRTFRTAVGGRLLELEIGKVCEQANGQVMVKYGDTVVNVLHVHPNSQSQISTFSH